MLARSRKITFKNGAQIKTPILVPSFSSKGWRFKTDSGREVSEINETLKWSTEVITQSVLLSAYDIYHGHYDSPEELGEFSEITIIDSGGYETADDHDLPSIFTYPWPTKPWSPKQLEAVVSKLPKDNNIAIVNYDHGKERIPIETQIYDAITYFGNHPTFDSIFLLKPETKSQDYVQIKSIIKNVSKLRNFNIIGITEKEIGNTFHERMLNIAQLRTELDQQEIHAPIHVFGALDPIASILYFLAGAEIFDGLTWARYAYYKGLTLYNENYRILEHGPKTKLQHATPITFMKNLNYLESMKDQMINYVKSGSFDSFEYNRDLFEATYKGFISRR